jgi:hypothetical protein
LLDYYRGKLTLRKTAALAMHLPPGAETWREMGGPQAWTGEVFAIAAAVDALRVANWQRTEDAKNQRNYPEPLQPPKFEHERVMKAANIANQAAAFRARQRLRADEKRGIGDVGE